MTQNLRTFLAIELPESIKENIIDAIQSYQELTKSKIKWVSRDNLHITMKFLGEFNPPHVKILHDLLACRMKKIPVFQIHMDHLGAFPNLHAPKVIWLGINHPENLRQIFRHIEDSVIKLGYEADGKPFSPHLTLGRIRRDLSSAETKKIGEMFSKADLTFQAEFTAESVVFFLSELTREGPIYSKLFEVRLDSTPSLC